MAYMKRYLEDVTDPGVDIHSWMDAPHDETIMRKRKSKNYGVGLQVLILFQIINQRNLRLPERL